MTFESFLNKILTRLDPSLWIAAGGLLFSIIVLTFLLRVLVKRLSTPLIKWKPELQSSVEGLSNNLRLLILLAGFFLGVATLGLASYMTYEAYTLEQGWQWLMSRIPEGFWIDLASGIGLSVFLTWVLKKVLPQLDRGLEALQKKAVNFQGLRSNNEAITIAFDLLQSMVRRAGWLTGFGFMANWLLLPDQVSNGIFLALRIYLIVTIGLLFWRGLDAIIESLDALSKKYASTHSLIRYYEGLSGLIPIFRRSIEYIIYVSVASMAVHQIEFIRELAEWGPRLIKIIGIAFLARVVIEVMRLVVEEFLITRPKLTPQQRKARVTLTPLAVHLFMILIWFGAGVLMLREVGIDPFPILAGAGIVGLAVGLGAQNMMNDIVSGFVILFENYYLVGDWVRIGNAEGEVEAIGISNTRVRDEDGRLHIIRNGDVKDVINYSKEFIQATIEIRVPYDTPLEKVKNLLTNKGKELCSEQSSILEPTEFDGIEAFEDLGMLVRTTTKVKPGQHLQMERLLREEMVLALESEDIKISYNRFHAQGMNSSQQQGSAGKA